MYIIYYSRFTKQLVGPGRDAFVSGAESNQKEEVTEESQKTFRRRWRRRKVFSVSFYVDVGSGGDIYIFHGDLK